MAYDDPRDANPAEIKPRDADPSETKPRDTDLVETEPKKGPKADANLSEEELPRR